MKQIPSTFVRELTSAIVGSLLFSAVIVSQGATQPAAEHVIGNFCSTCMELGSQNQLYDDGLHNDGAAGDGVWGVDITVDQPAGQYWFYYSTVAAYWHSIDYPRTYACAPTIAANLWTTGPGDVIHFRLGGAHTNPSGTYWEPGDWFPDYAMSTDHATPRGAGISFRLSNPAAPSGYWLVPATRHGTIWLSEWRIPDDVPFASLGGIYWVVATPGPSFIFSYNGYCYYWNEDPTARWSASRGRTMWLVFDETTGQFQNSLLAPTPVQRTSWGALKAHYR